MTGYVSIPGAVQTELRDLFGPAWDRQNRHGSTSLWISKSIFSYGHEALKKLFEGERL
jgi:hypothetical protein